jgi:hypothetical protein
MTYVALPRYIGTVHSLTNAKSNILKASIFICILAIVPNYAYAQGQPHSQHYFYAESSASDGINIERNHFNDTICIKECAQDYNPCDTAIEKRVDGRCTAL